MLRAKLTLENLLPYILILTGIVGMAAAFVLTFDEMQMLKNPQYQPGCNINPIIACGDVIQTRQGSIFGFPNPWLGLAAFAVLVTVGVSILAGAKFKRWFWLGIQLGATLGLVFIGWLFYQSMYNIHALCPWCMGVWSVVILTFWYVTVYNLRHRNIRLPAGKAWQKAGGFLNKHHLDILALGYLVIIGWILSHFWYYFGSHLF